MTDVATTMTPDRLAINRVRSPPPDPAAIDAFVADHEVPIVEDTHCTFLWRGDADEAWICQRVVGLPDRIPMRQIERTDLWFLVLELPAGSRVEYQVETRRGSGYERFNDPLNHNLSHSPIGS